MTMLLYLAPLSLIAFSVPFILRRVPRNAWYGLHTTRSVQGSLEDWYRINRAAAINVVYASAADLLITLAFRLLGPLHPAEIIVLAALFPFLVALALLGIIQQHRQSS